MTGLGLAAALPFNQTKGDPLLSLGPVFAIRAKDSVEGEQWALNKGTGGQVLRARYGSVGRAEIRRGVGLIHPGGTAYSTDYANCPMSSVPMNNYSAIRFEVEMPTGLNQINARVLSLASTSVGTALITLNGGGYPAIEWHDNVGYKAITCPTLTPVGATALAIYFEKNSGGGNSRATFYTAASIDSTWTLLGQATVASSGQFTTENMVGFRTTHVGSGQVNYGVTARARCYLDGVLTADIDFTQQNDLTTSFTCTTGQTVTVTAVNAVDTNDPLLLKKAAENYVLLPGTNLNNVSIPDAANLQPTTSMSYRSLVALEDWTPSTSNLLASQWTTGNDKCWAFSVTTSGNLEWRGSIDLTAQAIITSTLPISSVVSDNEKIAVRVDWTASPAEIKFYYKTVNGSAIDAITSDSDWTQLGTTVTASVPSTSLANSTEAFRFGAHGGTSFMAGKLFAGVLYVNSSLIISADFTTNTNQNSFVCSTGQTVTFNRSSSGRKLTVVTNPVWLLGTDDYLEVLDNDLLDFNNIDHTVLVITRWWDTAITYGAIVVKNQTAPFNDGWTLAQNNGSGIFPMYFEDEVGSIDVMGCDNIATQGQLFLFAGIREGTVNKNYVNNSMTSVSAPDVSDLRNSGVMRIGSTPFNAYYADMELFAVYIFRKALTAAEIAAGVQYWNAA